MRKRRGQELNLHALAGACFQNKFLTIRSTPPLHPNYINLVIKITL